MKRCVEIKPEVAHTEVLIGQLGTRNAPTRIYCFVLGSRYLLVPTEKYQLENPLKSVILTSPKLKILNGGTLSEQAA